MARARKMTKVTGTTKPTMTAKVDVVNDSAKVAEHFPSTSTGSLIQPS